MEVKIPVCEMCGHELGVEVVPGYIICTSDYMGGPVCLSCIIERCCETNCLGCELGTYPDCGNLEIKRHYMADD